VPKVHTTSAVGSSRIGRGRHVASSLAEINVVPLVDIMLVLLIIFMVTAPMLQRGIEVKLPQARNSGTIEGDRIWVTIPLRYRQDQILYLGEEQLRADVLEERIRQLVQGRTDKQVYLRGDGGVLLQEFMDVVDRLKDAGILNIGFVTAPKSDR
jgi:biopolymer transport protein ExbD